MPGPIGNKHALGNSGKPPQYDYVKVGKEFVEWALNNPDAFTVPQFSAPRGISSDMFWKWAESNDEFRRLFNIGKEIIGINRLKASINKDENGNAKLDRSIYMKTLHHYDFDFRKGERDEKQFESNLKVEENKPQSNVVVQHIYKKNDTNN